MDATAIARATEAWEGVDAVYLFGSQARGTAHRDSDVDVAVLLDRVVYETAAERFDARVRLTSDLIGALHVDDVDVVVLNDAPPLLARAILRDGVRLRCPNPEATTAFTRQVLLRAADLHPFMQRMRRLTLEAISR